MYMKNIEIQTKSEYPLITIVTVSYNSVNTIEQTISSVINQDYPNIEYIIIDGGSKDGTIDIIKKYEKFINHWISEPDRGIYHAMNKGIDIAKGNFIHFLNSDDCFVNYGIVSKICEVLRDNTQIDVLGANVWIVDEKNNFQSCVENDLNEKKIYNGRMTPHPGMIVRKEVLQVYHFNENYKISSDYNLFLEIYYSKKYNFKFINDCIVFFSNGGISSGSKLCLREQADLMEKFHLSLKVIDKKRKKGKETVILNLKRCLEEKTLKKTEEKIKDFLKFIGLRRNNKKKKERHFCNLKICRWCNRYE